MYESLVEWCRFPFKLHTYLNTSLSGDKTFSPPIDKVGYVVDEITEIIDKTGSKYISSTHIYYNDTDIKVADKISTGYDSPREIRKIGSYFDGEEGISSIQVIYL